MEKKLSTSLFSNIQVENKEEKVVQIYRRWIRANFKNSSDS